MRSHFRGLIHHTTAEFDELWKAAIFSFDANVLLNAYRLEKASSDAFLTALGALKGRAWLPYQVGVEFFRHRDEEIQRQFAAYGKIRVHLSGLADEFKRQFPRHPHAPLAAIARDLEGLSGKWTIQLDKLLDAHPNPTYDDPTLALYLSVFEGMMGDKPADAELKKWHDEAEARYELKIPPGFEDAKRKKDAREYGDAVLWFQLLAYAKRTQKPIVFVTDDVKEDWWQRVSGKTIGPHPALGQEMYEKAGVLFHAYPMHRFVEESEKRRGEKPDKAVIDNIKAVERTPAAQKRRGPEVARWSHLPEDALDLLITTWRHGRFIICHTSAHGMIYSVGDRLFGAGTREEAEKWAAMIAELRRMRYLRDHAGRILRLTPHGQMAAQQILRSRGLPTHPKF